MFHLNLLTLQRLCLFMTTMKIQIVNKGHQPLPAYATVQSAGMDLRANIVEPIVLRPMERRLIPTGLYMSLPAGYEAQVRPRSGLALKKGITVLNSPGTIDADYRGEKTSSSTTVSALPRWSLQGTRPPSSSKWRHSTRPSAVPAAMATRE